MRHKARWKLLFWVAGVFFRPSIVTAENLEYLIKIAEQNISWVSLLTKIVAGLTAIIALALGSILYYLFTQLRELNAKNKLTQKQIEKIQSHEQNIFSLTKQITQIKNEMTDANLHSKKIDESQIVDLVRTVLNKKPTIWRVNYLKDLLWREGIETLGEIEKILSDKPLMDKIRNRYFDRFKESPGEKNLIDWCYAIKKKGRTIESLLNEEVGAKKEAAEVLEYSLKFLSNRTK